MGFVKFKPVMVPYRAFLKPNKNHKVPMGLLTLLPLDLIGSWWTINDPPRPNFNDYLLLLFFCQQYYSPIENIIYGFVHFNMNRRF